MANFAWLVLKQKTIKTALLKFRFYLPLKKCLDLPLCNLIYPLHWLKLVHAVVLERKISSSLCLYHAPFEKDGFRLNKLDFHSVMLSAKLDWPIRFEQENGRCEKFTTMTTKDNGAMQKLHFVYSNCGISTKEKISIRLS